MVCVTPPEKAPAPTKAYTAGVVTKNKINFFTELLTNLGLQKHAEGPLHIASQ